MKHIVDNLLYKLMPSHFAIMGDLFSYQRTSDEEFQIRLSRFDNIFGSSKQNAYIVNITGNHDIGYGNEIHSRNLQRFEKHFGKTNFVEHFDLSSGKITTFDSSNQNIISVAVLNNLLMDPSADQKETKVVTDFVNQLTEWRRTNPTHDLLLFSHVPLYKPLGCVDKPKTKFDFRGYVAAQNHLSYESTRIILDKIEPDIILTGHDHHGCNYIHTNSKGKSVPEYTIRSIMGDYGGGGALLEIFRSRSGVLRHNFHYCPFTPFKIVTTTIVVNIIVILPTLVSILFQKMITTKRREPIKEACK